MHRTFISLFFLFYFNTQLFASDPSESLQKQVDYADSLAKNTLLKEADMVYDLVLDELKKSKTLNSTFGIELLQKKATYLEQDNKHEEAILILLEILDLSKEDNYPDLYLKVYLDLALIHEKIGDFTTCKDYLNRAAKMFIEGNINDSLYSYHCIRWASYYRLMGIQDSAIKYAELAIKNLKGTKPIHFADAYLIMGLTLSNLDPDRAIENYTLAKKQMAFMQDKVSIGFMNLNIASLYLKRGEFINSMTFCDSAYAIMQDTKDPSLAEYVYRLKMKIYSSQNLFDSAFYYAQLYHESSTQNLESLEKEKIIEIQEKYQSNLQDEIIFNYKKQSRRQIFALIFIILFALTLIVSLLIINILNRRLEAEKLRINQMNESLMLSNEQLKESLGMQEVLFDEIHHRVNNNWQIISNILELQANSSDDSKFKTLVQESQNRIKVMSYIQSILYQSKDLSQVNMTDYLRNLLNSIHQSMRSDSCLVDCKFVCEAKYENCYLNINKAIPLGLIMVELVTNSFKHAFTGMSEGRIEVSLNKIDNKVQFIVSDNGKGFEYYADQKDQKKMGIKIVQGLVRQLNAKFEQVSDENMKFIISFKI